MEVNHIIQKHPWGCAVACTAMMLGKTYDELFEAFGNPTEGLGIDKKMIYLWDQGLDVRWFDKQLPVKGTPAIVVVNSKNFAGKYHSIFFCGEKFYDPSPNKKYELEDWHGVEANIYGTVQIEVKDV